MWSSWRSFFCGPPSPFSSSPWSSVSEPTEYHAKPQSKHASTYTYRGGLKCGPQDLWILLLLLLVTETYPKHSRNLKPTFFSQPCREDGHVRSGSISGCYNLTFEFPGRSLLRSSLWNSPTKPWVPRGKAPPHYYYDPKPPRRHYSAYVLRPVDELPPLAAAKSARNYVYV